MRLVQCDIGVGIIIAALRLHLAVQQFQKLIIRSHRKLRDPRQAGEARPGDIQHKEVCPYEQYCSEMH